MTNQFKTPQLPRIVRTVTHNDRPYKKPELKPPVFEDATQPVQPYGILNRVLDFLSKPRT